MVKFYKFYRTSSTEQKRFLFNLDHLFLTISSRILTLFFATSYSFLSNRKLSTYPTIKNLSRITIFFSVTNKFHYLVRDKKSTWRHWHVHVDIVCTCNVYCSVENNYVRASRKVEKSLGEISLFLSIFAWATAVIWLWFISIYNRAL